MKKVPHSVKADKPILLYPITVSQAPMMAQTGSFYGFRPYRESTVTLDDASVLVDKRYFDGWSGEPDRVYLPAEDIAFCLGRDDELLVLEPRASHEYADYERDGRRYALYYELGEVVRRGKVIDRRYGTTRPLVAGEESTTYDELVKQLQALWGAPVGA